MPGGGTRKRIGRGDPTLRDQQLPALHADYVCCLKTFGALQQVELHRFTFVERAVSVLLNSGEMHKHVFAGGALNKTIAFRAVKPLHCTPLSHKETPFASALLWNSFHRPKRPAPGLPPVRDLSGLAGREGVVAWSCSLPATKTGCTATSWLASIHAPPSATRVCRRKVRLRSTRHQPKCAGSGPARAPLTGKSPAQ